MTFIVPLHIFIPTRSFLSCYFSPSSLPFFLPRPLKKVEVCPPPSVGATATFHLLMKGQNQIPPHLAGSEHYASSSVNSFEKSAGRLESDTASISSLQGDVGEGEGGREVGSKDSNSSSDRFLSNQSHSLSCFGEPNAKFAPFSVAYDPASFSSSSSSGLKLLLEVGIALPFSSLPLYLPLHENYVRCWTPLLSITCPLLPDALLPCPLSPLPLVPFLPFRFTFRLVFFKLFHRILYYSACRPRLWRRV